MFSTQKNKDTAHRFGLLKKCGVVSVQRSIFHSMGVLSSVIIWRGDDSIRFQIASFEFTTLTCIPGGIVYHAAKIQVSYGGILKGLLEKIWEYLDLTRISTKPKGMKPDYEDPVILFSKKRTIEDFCERRIHKDMVGQFKHFVWGSSIKHKPQRAGKEHELEDEGVVQVIKKV